MNYKPLDLKANMVFSIFSLLVQDFENIEGVAFYLYFMDIGIFNTQLNNARITEIIVIQIVICRYKRRSMFDLTKSLKLILLDVT